MWRKLFIVSIAALLSAMSAMGQQTLGATVGDSLNASAAPFTIAQGLFNQKDSDCAGLHRIADMQTFTVFSPRDSDCHYNHCAVMTPFKGALYCMWQSSRQDEDATDTWTAYARSTDDGQTWTSPMVLCPATDSTYSTDGGWLVAGDTLVAFINVWPDSLSPRGGFTQFVMSTDGNTWSEPANVLMADGSPMLGVIEQDPHRMNSGRIVAAVHFQPGMQCWPVYTDDPTGTTGWHRAESYAFNPNLIEPSTYLKADGNIVMIFRDQKSSFYKYACESADGSHWSNPVMTDMPDCRMKQAAGNCPDGRAFMVTGPIRSKKRAPLALALSADGDCFNEAWLLKSASEVPQMRYNGKAKNERSCFSYPKAMIDGRYLYVSFATNKEDIQYVRVPLTSLP